MKKLVLSVAMTAMFAGAALAADLPVKAMAPPVVTYGWTGCYVGAGAGYGMWDQRHRTYFNDGTARSAYDVDTAGKGWFGTVQVGCDYQVHERWVVGVFGDYDLSRLKGNFQPTSFNVIGEEKQRDSWAFGGRVGYLIFPRLLGYVSGGYTQARFDSVALSNFFAATPFGTLSGQTYKGWFLGTGYEYALDFLPGLFWKTEYRYASYRPENLLITDLGGTVASYERSQKDIQTIRTELVWRFNFGGPIVARY